MELKFSKYHGCGNDFIIIKEEDVLNQDYSMLAEKLCNRHIGVGADGLIIVRSMPLEMVFYNADGSRGAMCGNGIRCFSKFCLDNKIVVSNDFDVSTLAGVLNIKENHGQYTVKMGKPIFDTKILKMNTDLDIFLNQTLYGVNVSVVLIGVIHAVVFVDSVEEAMKSDLGEKICNSPLFSDRANVNFVEVEDEKNFKVRTYERGVGWTLACGTGACASFIIGNLEKKCHDYVDIHFQYGTLKIEKRDDDFIYMSGPATKIASGILYF